MPKTYKQRTVRVRTKNPSAQPLRGLIFVPFLATVRLGSLTPTKDIFTKAKPGATIVECNTPDAIENSRNKLRMKRCFTERSVPQAMWTEAQVADDIIRDLKEFPIIGKRVYGFKGIGMAKINSMEELTAYVRKNSGNRVFYEKFYNFGKEYRIHATQTEAFLSWRKLRREDATEKWYFNSNNCNWVNEEHELFDRPTNWSELEEVACRAISSVGLDIGCVDLRIQNNGMSTPKYIVCEVNSAPHLGNVGLEAYREQIQKVLLNKHKQSIHG